VILLSSRAGETIFQMKVARGLAEAGVDKVGRHEQVVPDENVRT